MAGGLALLAMSGCARLADSEGVEPQAPAIAEEKVEIPSDQPPAPIASDTAAEEPEQVNGGDRETTPEERYQIFKAQTGVVGSPSISKALATVDQGGDITLNFVDADIREVLRTTLGGILDLNYVVAPEVQGMVTVQSGRPVPYDSLLPTIETLLRMYGVAIVKEGGLYRVQALQGAARGNTSIRLGISGATPDDAYGIQIVPLHYVSATQMAETLRPIAREGGVLHIDETRNVIMLGGTRFELVAFMEAIEIFDVNWMSGMSFGLFSLEYADALTLEEELSAILGDGKRGVAGGLVRLVAVKRLNAILAVSRQPRYLEQVRQWVERLDKPGGEGSGDQQLYIYFAQNAKAASLAEVLNDVFVNQVQTSQTPAVRQRPGGLAPGLEPVEIGDAQQGSPDAVPGDPQTGQPAKAAQPTPVPKLTGGIALSRGGQVRVVADEERNALLISGTAGEYRAVLRSLKQLDRRPLEVLIEVTIADVTLSDKLEYGVRWFFKGGGADDLNHRVTLGGLGDGPAALSSGLTYVYSVTNVKAVLDLLSSVTDVEVISAPQLLVLNNQEALLQVGAQVPVATQQSVDTGSTTAPIVSTIEMVDTGVILKVTPRVNDSGLVILDIEQEVSQVSQDSVEGTLTPTISTRLINTTAAVQSGQTVALGGLIQDNKTNTKVGVPGLSAIPYFGALFRHTTDSIIRSELLVLVTPRVIRDERGAMEITNELRRRLEDIERLEAKIAPRQEDRAEDEPEEKPEGEPAAE
jgi:general secretion pathway protein D